MDVDTWQLDLAAIRADPDFPGTEAERLEAHGLVATSPGEGPIGLILQGHVDVVPVGDRDNWRDGDPFSGSIVGNVLHGRGACDMKAGVAANFAIARALTRSGVATHKRLAIHSVVSEEDGGLGAFDTLRRGHTGEAAIITEPTSGRLITANAGALTFEIRVTGQAAHGSTRLEGVSAYEVFWPIHLALRELEARRNAAPDPLFADHALAYGISIGRIVAGDWSSSVPDLLVAQGRYGIQLGEDLAVARREFEDAVADRSPSRDLVARRPVRLGSDRRGPPAHCRGPARRRDDQRTRPATRRRPLRLGPSSLHRPGRHTDIALWSGGRADGPRPARARRPG